MSAKSKKINRYQAKYWSKAAYTDTVTMGCLSVIRCTLYISANEDYSKATRDALLVALSWALYYFWDMHHVVCSEWSEVGVCGHYHDRLECKGCPLLNDPDGDDEGSCILPGECDGFDEDDMEQLNEKVIGLIDKIKDSGARRAVITGKAIRTAYAHAVVGIEE